MTNRELLELIDAYLWEIQEGKDSPSAEDILLDLKTHIKENSLVDIEMNKQGLVKISDLIQKDLEVLKILKKYLITTELTYTGESQYVTFDRLVFNDSIDTGKDFYKIKEWLENEH